MYDFAIIGGGPTAYAAAMYAGRLNLSTVVINGIPGGLIITTDVVENYPGFKRIGGYDLFQNIQEHARMYKITEVSGMATKVKKDDSGFIVATQKETYQAKTLLFATGASHKKMAVPNAGQFENKGIHYCALCDGFGYKNKVVAVVGGADSALKESLQLAIHAKKIYILCRGKHLRGESVNLTRVSADPKISVITEINVVNILGNERVEGVETDRQIDGNTKLAVDGIFVAIGHVPQSELAKSLGVLLNEKGEIIINRFTETNIRGVYAAGDVVDTPFKQLILGCAEGVTAAFKAYEYLAKAV